MIINGFDTISHSYGEYDAIAGVATAGIAHGALLAQKQDMPFAYVRASKKDHGRQNQIEGSLTSGQRVLVIEDLISTGGSSLAAVEVLRAAGCEVVATLAIFQYNFAEAKQRFDNANCPFATLSDYETLVNIAASEGNFSDHDLNLLRSWHTDPHQWMNK